MADFLINHTRVLDEKIDSYIALLYQSVTSLLDKHSRKLDQCLTLLPIYANRLVEKKFHSLELMEKTLELLSPEAILKKGFAIVEKNGKAVKTSDLKTDDEIKIKFIDGVVGAKIKV